MPEFHNTQQPAPAGVFHYHIIESSHYHIVVLIPCEIKRDVQFYAEVAAHIEYTGAAGNIINRCIFQPA
jgi:hypothetical protein